MTPTTLTPEATAAAQVALQQLRSEMKSALVGRDAEIDGLLLALLARTHVLLLGPPGTAKSLVTQIFAGSLVDDASAANVTGYFQRLLTAFTSPDEVFGPYDISALDAGRYERAVQGYLPTARTAFLDEVFKANSAVLNALLTGLNERQFDNGTSRVDMPLQVCVGASNEYPADSSLDALYDRFQLRFWTEYVPTRNDRMRLLTCPDPASQVQATLSESQVTALQQQVRQVVVPQNVLEALLDIAEKLATEHGMVISDRRLRQAVKLVQARAALNGRTEARKVDLQVLSDSVWQRHDQRPAVHATVLSCAAPALAAAQQLADAARELVEALGAGATIVELERTMEQVMSIEGELGSLDVEADELDDVSALRAEVAGCRKAVARRFVQTNPHLTSALR